MQGRGVARGVGQVGLPVDSIYLAPNAAGPPASDTPRKMGNCLFAAADRRARFE